MMEQIKRKGREAQGHRERTFERLRFRNINLIDGIFHDMMMNQVK